MLHILMICTGGISTTLFVKKMQEAVLQQHINAHVWAIPGARIEEEIPKADMILLEPHSRYFLTKVKQLTTRPIMNINMMAYSRMGGEAVLKVALNHIS